MDRVRQRITAVRWLVTTARSFRSEHFPVTEGVFVQFRKTLELIAFAPLSAHRKQYSEAYANYQLHWRAKDMLKAVKVLNPDFYPKDRSVSPQARPCRQKARGSLPKARKKRGSRRSGLTSFAATAA